VFPDVGRQREILNMHVKCNNRQASCSWTGELRNLEVSYVKIFSSFVVLTSNRKKRKILALLEVHLKILLPKTL